MRFYRLGMLVALGVCASTTDAIAAKPSKFEQAAINSTPEQVALTVAVTNSELDTDVRISTEPFFRLRGGDKFLRAYIDKKTGETTIQVYLWTQYRGDWQFYDRVNYATPDGPVAVDAIRIDSSVLGCSRYGCTMREDIAFTIAEPMLRRIASGARAGTDDIWQFKVMGKYEGGETTGVLKTEAAGLLIALDRVRAALRLPAPADLGAVAK